ncbi:MAG: hypothetical protein KOO63_15620 [Bacteroidales bacterium]|nr:hypothetical protein [Candidatus Latescibacterota bacterium]
MKKGLLVITALLIAVVLPMSLAAQEKDVEVKVEVKECDHGHGKSIHCEHSHGKSINAKCSLAPEISLKIEKLVLELKLKNLELEKKQTDIHKKVYSQYIEENPDGKKIKKLTKAMLAVKAELMENQHEHFMAVRKLVSAEQFKMFMACQGHGSKMGKGMHGKMGHGSMSCCSQGKMSGCSSAGAMHGCKSGKSCCSSGKSMSGCKSIKSGKGCGSHGDAMSGCKNIKIKCEVECCKHTDKSKCTEKCKEIKIIKKIIE